jgi:carboxylesterase type B
MLCAAALTLSLFASLASCSYPTAPTVHVKNGSYVGVYSDEYKQDYFLGVPFAQPPVEALRYRNPVSLNQSWSEVRPATAYSTEVCINGTSHARPTC